MDRLNLEILAPVVTRAAILARIDALESEIAAGLLRNVRTATEYRTINNIVAQQHAEALVFAAAGPTTP